MYRALSILILVAFTGCTHLPVDPVSYDGTATVHSSKIVGIGLSTIGASGTSGTAAVPLGGGASIPMAVGPYPHLMFTEEDQRIFANSLRTELGRLGILQVADPSDATSLKIEIVFVHTEHKYDF